MTENLFSVNSHSKQSFAFSALQTGVKVIIIISMLVVVLVIIYAVLYRLCKGRLGKLHR